eukprot:TRINITY_DN6867_c0_g1_i1.p1 TRINITY_DN6867_c0_g1~~TRINITY_DN6867_c0_g1_i1.p1  ORF type:complete len:1026 (-),score=191.03 TRINITY_DN6867_c0_g1_i1:336-3413(-)
MKRSSSGGNDGAMDDAKRAKEDGGSTEATASATTASASGGADRENTLLLKVLQPVPPPSEKLTLATVGNFLENQSARLGRLEEGLLFLAKGWRRCEEGGVVPSTWAGIAPLQESMLNAGLVMLLSADSVDKIRALCTLLDNPVPAKLMNKLLEAGAEDETVLPELIAKVAKPLRGRTLNEVQSGQVAKLIRVLRSSKKYAIALTTSPSSAEIWRPVFEPKFTWRNRKREVVARQRPGSLLQHESLLGWVLSPSPLDSAASPPSKAHATEAGSPEWSDLRRSSRQRIDGLQRGTQMKLTGIQAQTAELVDILLRAGDGPRCAVLEWLGALLGAAEPRGKQGYIAPEGFNFWPNGGHHVIDVLGHKDTSPFEKSLKNLLLLQALQARIQGFPTSGIALNACTLLLHLCKPIGVQNASGLSPFFALRSDVPDILGSWQKESRFGEKDHLEAALESAKADPAYSLAPNDKSLFKTQVFWLTSKSIGTCLLPVLKEALQVFQGIASMFYEKDPETSDIGWREFLLAESAFREGSFIERLAHFVNLSFRFLQHMASGGQEALPPPEPGPAWHALPSALLENVLDVCDLYRDRTKKSNGIPSGLYAHIDPGPMLTTLCIVMASDAHVRDPSLRGRAVELMHRLCFAFPSWQEKLNQPPLLKHFVPCLVGVFTAVEKAIMSYFDLAYRYKYELRVPVMDLFDLCLQHAEHKRVLLSFASGVGKDRFLKLLTQLINDTNSQTEEALRTLKDYHEHQKTTTEANGPTETPQHAQHDEQVGEDDQTDGGEDVYRRSRMNYKEHAKKYFALSSRTWKQLWLLCQHCAGSIVEAHTILEQLIHSSLDAQLHWLVGPEMKTIRATQQEYEEVGFNPKDMVKQIAEIYLFLARANREEVSRIVSKDERYYSNATFAKAVRFARKYSLLHGEQLEEFDRFVRALADIVSQQRAAVDEADIPDEFLCELMADIMSDPVMFPQSKKIVDRSSAERQIMGTDRDPYANTPVTTAELVPLPELKARIHLFAKEKGIVLEGGNIND